MTSKNHLLFKELKELPNLVTNEILVLLAFLIHFMVLGMVIVEYGFQRLRSRERDAPDKRVGPFSQWASLKDMGESRISFCQQIILGGYPAPVP